MLLAYKLKSPASANSSNKTAAVSVLIYPLVTNVTLKNPSRPLNP